jgi:hypothetical protein
MTVARNVTLATPITVDLLQLGNSYITRQLKKVEHELLRPLQQVLPALL